MNIPTKVLRSTFITYETYFHHQQLAKKFYKSSTKVVKRGPRNFEERNECDSQQISYMIYDTGSRNYRQELVKW
jgi:hypothetical protein